MNFPAKIAESSSTHKFPAKTTQSIRTLNIAEASKVFQIKSDCKLKNNFVDLKIYPRPGVILIQSWRKFLKSFKLKLSETKWSQEKCDRN